MTEHHRAMKTGTTEQREQKILFVQQQMNLLQVYGAYGYEVLESLRERIQQLDANIEESWREDHFLFSYKSITVCSFYWQYEDMVCIVLYDKVNERTIEFAHECKQGKQIEWSVITGSIIHSIRELEAREILIK